MKKLILLSAFIIFLQSCQSKLIPLKGGYQETPVKSIYESSLDSVWEAVIDFISDTGQDVQLIDKDSGLIISDVHIARSKDMSHEDSKGKIINAGAIIAVERYSTEFPSAEVRGRHATAKWTIRVKKESEIVTSVSALLHIRSIQYDDPKLGGRYDGKSTGNYEKGMLDQISERLIE